MQRGARIGVCAVLALLLGAAAAQAVITALLPLQKVVGDADVAVVTAHVTAFDADGRTLVLVVDQTLKGSSPGGRWTVRIEGAAAAETGKEVPQFLKRVANDVPVVLFVTSL